MKKAVVSNDIHFFLFEVTLKYQSAWKENKNLPLHILLLSNIAELFELIAIKRFTWKEASRGTQSVTFSSHDSPEEHWRALLNGVE